MGAVVVEEEEVVVVVVVVAVVAVVAVLLLVVGIVAVVPLPLHHETLPLLLHTHIRAMMLLLSGDDIVVFVDVVVD